MTILEAYNNFMFEQRVRNNSSATIDFYTAVLGAFVDWVTQSTETVEELTIKQYKEYIIHLSSSGLKSTSVNTHVRAVKAFYNFLIDEEKIGDCSRKLKLIKQSKEEIIPLTDDEIGRLLACFNCSDVLELRNKCFVLLMLDCGLRRSELTRLKVSDVDFIQKSLLVNGKGNKQRIVPMGATTAQFLGEYDNRVQDKRSGKPSAPFLLDRFGNGIDNNVIKMVFQDLKERSGIQRLHPHLLRHTFATLYLVDGGNLEMLRCILGHSTISITQIYLHLSSNYALIRSAHNSHVDRMQDNLCNFNKDDKLGTP